MKSISHMIIATIPIAIMIFWDVYKRQGYHWNSGRRSQRSWQAPLFTRHWTVERSFKALFRIMYIDVYKRQAVGSADKATAAGQLLSQIGKGICHDLSGVVTVLSPHSTEKLFFWEDLSFVGGKHQQQDVYKRQQSNHACCFTAECNENWREIF